jgi:hypothetical protein
MKRSPCLHSGIFVPVVSAIFPIRHALGQNLHDSLDTKRQKGA